MTQISLAGMPLGARLYQEVKRKILESLRDGEWKPGEMIPSEKRLGERYGVSIGTVRKAVDELADENILIRHQGLGTFVASHNHDRYVFSFFHVAGQDGRREYPHVELVSFSKAKADSDSAQRLGIRSGARVFRMTNRLDLAQRPVIVDDIMLPEHLFPGLDEGALRERPGTLYQLYQDSFGVGVLRIEERLRACPADARSAELLGVPEGKPLLHVIRRALTFRDEVVELRHSFVDTTDHEYFADEDR